MVMFICLSLYPKYAQCHRKSKVYTAQSGYPIFNESYQKIKKKHLEILKFKAAPFEGKGLVSANIHK